MATKPSNPDAEATAALRGSWLKRVGLAALIAIVALNIWTGSPLLGLWVGSRVQGEGPPTMGAVGVVFLVIVVVSVALFQALKALGAAYDRATGQSSTVRTHVPWLRSMSGERPQYPGMAPTLSALERVMVVMVIIAFVAFEIWFFFFSGSPIGGGGPSSGR